MGSKNEMTNVDRAMSKIYFEKQDGRLCGQHAINNALQGKVFTAVDLANIAATLDEMERETMAQGGIDSKEYRDYIKKPSANYDDSGYFSVQVLCQALKNMNLDMVSYLSEDERAKAAVKSPQKERLFIFHSNDHWFSIRRFGEQWINLNSSIPQPDLINSNSFEALMKSLQLEGYTIYVVFGILPPCPADPLWENLKIGSDGEYIIERVAFEGKGQRLGTQSEMTDEELLQEGIDMSLGKETQQSLLRAKREAFLARLNPK